MICALSILTLDIPFVNSIFCFFYKQYPILFLFIFINDTILIIYLVY